MVVETKTIQDYKILWLSRPRLNETDKKLSRPKLFRELGISDLKKSFFVVLVVKGHKSRVPILWKQKFSHFLAYFAIFIRLEQARVNSKVYSVLEFFHLLYSHDLNQWGNI